MPQTVEVRFKGNRKGLFDWPEEGDLLRMRDAVIVDADRGQDLGRISAVGETALKKCGSGCSGCAVGEAPPGDRPPVLRRASRDDVSVHEELRRSEEDVRRKIIERVRAHDLPMKISDSEWQWDRKKLTVYFTSEKRVDFRGLVRDLAGLFKTRIELRQIGVRDEAARLSGVGRCGREYCCSTWLTELSPVNLGLAKDQHLSLNPSQISGGCGRLLCCLKYEHEFYVTARKRFPKEGKVLVTARGPEKVVAVDLFRERVFLRSEQDGPRIVPLIQLKEEMEAVGGALPPPQAEAPAPQAPPDPRPTAAAPPPAPVEPPAGKIGEPAAPRSKRRRRGRRRRGGGSGGAPPQGGGG
ncbi:MAG TPA: regulatory iron-sulfur-containing complex subunit RicT [Gemmatimonadales bacterium]|jgi:cell fate regulator YaaT (PSP1 superfamily)|nr:regulatory iron-sulfur-containing complex subunit RicT [Gemmatimonadales bacterium]